MKQSKRNQFSGGELEWFKRLCRFTARQDFSQAHADISKGELKQYYNRLKDLGIKGHQPGIRGLCLMEEGMKRKIEEAIYRQRYRSTQKAVRVFVEYKSRKDGALLSQEGQTRYPQLPKVDQEPKWQGGGDR